VNLASGGKKPPREKSATKTRFARARKKKARFRRGDSPRLVRSRGARGSPTTLFWGRRPIEDLGIGFSRPWGGDAVGRTSRAGLNGGRKPGSSAGSGSSKTRLGATEFHRWGPGRRAGRERAPPAVCKSERKRAADASSRYRESCPKGRNSKHVSAEALCPARRRAQAGRKRERICSCRCRRIGVGDPPPPTPLRPHTFGAILRCRSSRASQSACDSPKRPFSIRRRERVVVDRRRGGSLQGRPRGVPM